MGERIKNRLAVLLVITLLFGVIEPSVSPLGISRPFASGGRATASDTATWSNAAEDEEEGDDGEGGDWNDEAEDGQNDGAASHSRVNVATGSNLATGSNVNLMALSLDNGVTIQDNGEIWIEAEKFYEPVQSEHPEYADLQPDTDDAFGKPLEINLSEVPVTIPERDYILAIDYAGNGQVMRLDVGDTETEVIFLKSDFDPGSARTVETMRTFHLTGKETIRFTAAKNRYLWMDRIKLIPSTEKRISLNFKDSCVEEYTPGDEDSNFMRMNTGDSVTLKLDSRFSKGAYQLLIYYCKQEAEYQIKINGKEADPYKTTVFHSWELNDFESGGWQGHYELNEGDTVTITTLNEGKYICVKDIVWRELPHSFYGKDLDTGIIVEADEGVLPNDTKLSVRPKGKITSDDFSDNDMRAVGYEIRLESNGKELDLSEISENGGDVKVTIPYPAGVDKDNDCVDIYYMDGDTGESLMAIPTEDGKGLQATMEECGIYAVTMEKGVYHYEAEQYYSKWADDGNAANFETGNGPTISIPLKKLDGFERGQYNLLLRYSGGGAHPLTIKVNGEVVGSCTLQPFSEWNTYNLAAAEALLDLRPSDKLTLELPPEEQYQWIDYIRLVEAEPFKGEEPSPDGSPVRVEAGIGALPYGAKLGISEISTEYQLALDRRFSTGTIHAMDIYFYMNENEEVRVTPASTVTVRMELPDDMDPKKYCLYFISGSGQGTKFVKVPSRIVDGEVVFTLGKETGVYALVEGAAYIPEDYDEDAIYTRSGGAAGKNAENAGRLADAAAATDKASAAMEGQVTTVKTRTHGEHYIYEGEAYYTKQGGTPTADLQPGAQMNIPLSDNRDFKSGLYQVRIRSNGNRQKFIIKVNHKEAGSLLRSETSFGMAYMTEDTMKEPLMLTGSDLLTVEGEGGEHYGWVDYVELIRVSSGQNPEQRKTVRYPAATLYAKPVDNYPAADLQPGDSLSFRVGDQPDFVEGAYRLGVSANGNRTRMWVRVNGGMAGSLVRVRGSGFESSDFTYVILNRNLNLKADDVISIEAPGNAEEGPWGWVETIELIPAPAATGERKSEYRYEGEDYYQASLYSPAADLQPDTAIEIPLSDDADFVAGTYRLSILSNGTRERFHIRVNGAAVGDIRRKASDYSDTDYSQDYLAAPLALKPGDVLTVTGESGDHYGWVNYILLETVE